MEERGDTGGEREGKKRREEREGNEKMEEGK